jgi:acyl dehydratase
MSARIAAIGAPHNSSEAQRNMRFAEDIVTGTPTDCGTASFSAEDIIEFARRYDPQPFHLSEQGGAESLLFGRLTASGLQTAAAGRFAVLRSAMRDVCLLGSPGASRFQMHKPVFPGMALRFTHTATEICAFEELEGAVLVRSLTRAVTPDGALVMTTDNLDWIGSRAGSHERPPSKSLELRDRATAASELLRRAVHLEQSAAASDDRTKLYLEDCLKDATFLTKPFPVTREDVEFFRSRYCALAADGRALTNEWYNIALGIRIFADAFWLRVANVGGSGMDDVRWPTPIAPGDVLRGQMRIAHSRRLRSKPTLGSVVSDCICANQRDEVVASFRVTTFIRIREPEPAGSPR